MPSTPINTAVLFLVFNRPSLTAQSFESIRNAKPPRLYVAADGPREGHQTDLERIVEAREIATAVDWPCEVKTLFRNENLGCKHAISGAITWFFEHEEQGIILEDDCVAHPDFYYFCDEVLDKYQHEEAISTVSGNNFQNGLKRGSASYYFSRNHHIWGWATWRRSWKLYQEDIPFWPEWRKSDDWIQKTPNPVERKYWKRILDMVYAKKFESTWDYPWVASLWFNGGLSVTPNINLVRNIGFGEDSVHTTDPSSALSKLQNHSLNPIVHPDTISQNLEADQYTFDSVFKEKNFIVLRRTIHALVFKIIRYLKK